MELPAQAKLAMQSVVRAFERDIRALKTRRALLIAAQRARADERKAARVRESIGRL